MLPPLVDADLARDLDVRKVGPATVADAVVRGLARNQEEIRVGPVRQLAPLARIAPRLADRLVQRALGVPRRS